MSNEEAQNDEIMAMASIFEEDVFESSSENGRVTGGRFSAHLELPRLFQVLFHSDSGISLLRSIICFSYAFRFNSDLKRN